MLIKKRTESRALSKPIPGNRIEFSDGSGFIEIHALGWGKSSPSLKHRPSETWINWGFVSKKEGGVTTRCVFYPRSDLQASENTNILIRINHTWSSHNYNAAFHE